MIRSPHENAALKGLRVLDLSDQPGQYCGKLLAEMGADVIRIEPPGGSPVRRIGPFYMDVPDPNASLTFWYYNTSKRGITLNLETAQGREYFRQLTATADVVLESTRPGYMEGLGLGYADLKQIRPDLIMCSVTPFGQNGPWVDFVASDLVHMALGGTMASCGYDSIPNTPPIAPTGGHSYHTSSYFCSLGIMAALLHRRKTGEGQYLDISVHDACAYSTEAAVHFWIYHQQVVIRQTGRHAWNTPSQSSQTRANDGRYAFTTIRPSDLPRWKTLVAWMAETGEADDLQDEFYLGAGAIKERLAHVMEVVGRFVSNHDTAFIYRGGTKLGLLWAPVNSVEEFMADPHFSEDRAYFTKVQHPEQGREFLYPGAPAKLSLSYLEIRGRAPRLGEHTRAILVDELGVSPDLLPILAEQSVV